MFFVEDKWSDGNFIVVLDDLLWRLDLEDWLCKLDLEDLFGWLVVVEWFCRFVLEDKRLFFEDFLYIFECDIVEKCRIDFLIIYV